MKIKISKLDENDPDWGPVLIIAGKYKGRIGWLEDDDRGKGIVYLGSIMNSNYIIIGYNCLLRLCGFGGVYEQMFGYFGSKPLNEISLRTTTSKMT